MTYFRLNKIRKPPKNRIEELLRLLAELKAQTKVDDLRPEYIIRNKIIQTKYLQELKELIKRKNNEIIK